MSQRAGFGEAPQQAFLRAPAQQKFRSVATSELLAVCALPINSLKLDLFHPLHGGEFSVIIALVYFFKNFSERA